jgi:mono/diheme cytochrome c family protein
MLRSMWTCLLVWSLLCVACLGESSLLRSTRGAPDDLEIEFTGSPIAGVRFVRLRDLLTLPQTTATVFKDENLFRLPPGGVTVQGVILDVLAARLGIPEKDYWIEAICNDKYDAPFPREYIQTHKPILVLRVNGISPRAWALQTGHYDPGDYLVAYDRFVPAFRALSHEDRQQVPSWIVRLKFDATAEVMATIAPRGRDAMDAKVVAAGRIAQQNCLRCHNSGSYGGTKAQRSWTTLGNVAWRDPVRFAAYVHTPKNVDSRAKMPPNPQYDEETLTALARYFAAFATEDTSGKGVH